MNRVSQPPIVESAKSSEPQGGGLKSVLLLSLLVLPGAGHVYLKYYARAAIFMLTSITLLWLLIDDAMHKADQISKMMVSGELALDVGAIMAALERASGLDPALLNQLSYGLLACWLLAAIDAWRLARR